MATRSSSIFFSFLILWDKIVRKKLSWCVINFTLLWMWTVVFEMYKKIIKIRGLIRIRNRKYWPLKRWFLSSCISGPISTNVIFPMDCYPWFLFLLVRKWDRQRCDIRVTKYRECSPCFGTEYRFWLKNTGINTENWKYIFLTKRWCPSARNRKNWIIKLIFERDPLKSVFVVSINSYSSLENLINLGWDVSWSNRLCYKPT